MLLLFLEIKGVVSQIPNLKLVPLLFHCSDIFVYVEDKDIARSSYAVVSAHFPDSIFMVFIYVAFLFFNSVNKLWRRRDGWNIMVGLGKLSCFGQGFLVRIPSWACSRA